MGNLLGKKVRVPRVRAIRPRTHGRHQLLTSSHGDFARTHKLSLVSAESERACEEHPLCSSPLTLQHHRVRAIRPERTDMALSG